MQRTRYTPRSTNIHVLLAFKADACPTPWGGNLLYHHRILLCPHNSLHNLGYLRYTLQTQKEGLMDERKSHLKDALRLTGLLDQEDLHMLNLGPQCNASHFILSVELSGYLPI